MLTINTLRCEYRVDPLGIDVTEPRLSWTVESPRRSQRQSAYRIIVASSPEAIADDDGNLWDSGRVESADTAHIPYTGTALASCDRCHWKVMVWSGDGDASQWSTPGLWTMGLMDAGDWEAKWIGYDTTELNEDDTLVLPPCPLMRTPFHVKPGLRRATIYASAMGLFELHLNGQRVGDDLFTPGWTSYGKRIQYFTYDVTDLLLEGDNALGAILGFGWYAGYVGFSIEINMPRHRAFYGEQIGLLAQLQIEYADGSRQVVASQDDWAAAIGPIRGSDFLMGETHDARQELDGWSEAGFDDTAWTEVAVLPPPEGELEANNSVTVRETGVVKPVGMSEPTAGTFVYNMGQNFAGYVQLRVRGEAGTKVVLRFAEMRNDDGTVMTENLRHARATDVYILKGSGEDEIWQPSFTFHGFQYVEVTGFPGTPDMETITGIVVNSDTGGSGHFACDHELVNTLFSNITWTQRANFIDLPTDCPQRDERLGWTGDAQVYIRAACCNMDVAAFFTKWINTLNDDQLESGAYTNYSPQPYGTLGDRYSSGWMNAGIICPWTIYHVYGDTRIADRTWDNMRRQLALQEEESTDYILSFSGGKHGDWLALDKNPTPHELTETAYFAQDADLMAQMAAATGRDEDAKYCRALFDKIAAAFCDTFVKETDDGLRIADDSQTGYVVPLAFGILPDDMAARAAARLNQVLEENDFCMGTGFIGTSYIMNVLSASGYNDTACRLITNTKFPSWGYSIVNGSTTIWERWNSYTIEDGFIDDSMNSFNHYAYGAVCDWMFSTMAGIDTDGPGFRRIRIQPQPGGSEITRAEARYESIRGPVSSRWCLADGQFELHVTIPANTTATVHIPNPRGAEVREGNGPAADAEGVTAVGEEKGATLFEIGSGTYRFSC